MLPEVSRSMLKNSLLLGVFAVITVGSVSLLRQGTAERIVAAERAMQQRALEEILPAGSYDQLLLDSPLQLTDPLLGSKLAQPAYRAVRAGQTSAVILRTTATDGYSGAIQLLVAIQADGRLAGVRTLQHRETPGLGDKIEHLKHPWILGFTGKSLQDPQSSGWAVKKDGGQFDQFAGATITPRAVVKAVHQALRYFDAHRNELLATEEASRG